ncbi:Scr1 family TA system antitoxin-like transcriptional regulator [Gordonia sp. NPDC003504]
MLREIRKAHGITMKDIVENTKVGTSRRFTQPTLSKVENGQLPLLEWSDVVVLLEAIGATAEERQTARRQYDICQLDENSFAFIHATGVDAKQRQLAQLTESARMFRCYSRSVFPGIVQVYDYAYGIYISLGLNHSQADRAANARVARGYALSDRSKHFVLVVDECALYSPHPSSTVGCESLRHQLDYTLRESYRTNIRVQVLRGTAPVTAEISGPFVLMDNRYVSAECVDREISSSDARVIESYERVFKSIFEAAEDEDASRSMIEKAIARFDDAGVSE